MAMAFEFRSDTTPAKLAEIAEWSKAHGMAYMSEPRPTVVLQCDPTDFYQRFRSVVAVITPNYQASSFTGQRLCNDLAMESL